MFLHILYLFPQRSRLYIHHVTASVWFGNLLLNYKIVHRSIRLHETFEKACGCLRYCEHTDFFMSLESSSPEMYMIDLQQKLIIRGIRYHTCRCRIMFSEVMLKSIFVIASFAEKFGITRQMPFMIMHVKAPWVSLTFQHVCDGESIEITI